MPNVVGPKGQVVISKDIRDRLGIEPGWIALQRLAGDHIEVFFLPPPHRKSLKGQLSGHIKKHITTDKEWKRAREMAWKKAAREQISGGK